MIFLKKNFFCIWWMSYWDLVWEVFSVLQIWNDQSVLCSVIRIWSPSSPSTLTRPTAYASSLTPRGNTLPQEALMLSLVCGTWRSWCVFAASPGQSVFLFLQIICPQRNVWMNQGSLFSCCSRCRLDWPVRTLSFSNDGKMLASASEDHFIDIAEVETGQ